MDAKFMKLAIEQAKQCINSTGAYNVGAVTTYQGNLQQTGYSRELPGNTHAEECCLMKSKIADTIYTTMEPCGRRLSQKTSCAELIIASGTIKQVFYVVTEPSCFIEKSVGLSMLTDAGIRVRRLDEFQDECNLLNAHLSTSHS